MSDPSSDDPEAKLSALGHLLPEPPEPVAAYVPCLRTGDLVFVSGQLPMTAGQLVCTGPVDALSDEQAQEAARQCTLNGLAILKREIGGDWSRLRRVVRVGCFVASGPEFTGHSLVANGASELLVKLFGERGKHARAAVGVSALPLGASVEIEFLFEVGSAHKVPLTMTEAAEAPTETAIESQAMPVSAALR